MENLIGYWTNLSRAYEIALLGNLSIQVGFSRDYKQGFSDYKLITEFFTDVWFVEEGDLKIEISQPNYLRETNKCEQLSDIHNRVELARKNVIPTKFKSDACNALLKNAIEKLNYSLEQKNNVIRVSGVIAQLENSKEIQAYHLAEAIQYNYSPSQFEPFMCNAVKESINFGDGIEIKLFQLQTTDIENAIKYLQTLLTDF